MRFFCLLLLWSGPLSARTEPAEAFLKPKEGEGIRVWIRSADANVIRYSDSSGATVTREIALPAVQALRIFTPPALNEAMVLYQGRQYATAKEKFAAVKEDYLAVASLQDNPSSAAGFMELECLRRTGDLEGLAKTLASFDRRGLSREHELRQLDIYTMWDAVRAKDWPRVESLATERLKERLPGYQQAQADYCLGLAYEGQGKAFPAIDAYQLAITADSGASEEIAREATVKALKIYRKDAGVNAAMKAGGPGRGRLLEAAGLAAMYELSPGAVPLPAEVKEFLKFRTVPKAAGK